MPNKRFNILIILICICIGLCGCGTSNLEEDSVNDVKKPYTLTDYLSSDEIAQYEKEILSIELSTDSIDWRLSYKEHPEESGLLYHIGIRGLPVLIDKTKCFEPPLIDPGVSTEHYRKFWFNGVIALLRCNERLLDPGGDGNIEVLDDLLFNAEERCLKIISSLGSTNSKIKQLREYGLLAIPYVVDEIEKGNSGFERFFTDIGLHLTTEEYMSYISDTYSPIVDRDSARYDLIRNHPKAEDFDYKVWLSENEEDLDNLFKFLDAYCAEYEAEMEN